MTDLEKCAIAGCEAEALYGLFCLAHADVCSRDLEERTMAPFRENQLWWTVVGLIAFFGVIGVLAAVERHVMPGKPGRVQGPPSPSFATLYRDAGHWQLVVQTREMPPVAVRDGLGWQECEDARTTEVKVSYFLGRAIRPLQCVEANGHWQRFWTAVDRWLPKNAQEQADEILGINARR